MADFNVSQQVQHAVMDPEGDVILELHDRTLLVSSKIISLASPVFKAMLGPSFTEGRPDASGRSTLKLPKDDPEAIHALFSMLHLQYQLSEADFNYKFLENLTVVADKYDCAKAVRALSTLFTQKLFELEKTWQSLDFGRLLCPAYVFDDPSLFRDVTRMLVYESADSNGIEFNASRYGMSEEMAELIPSEILAKLGYAERRMKTSLQADLEDLISPLLHQPIPSYRRRQKHLLRLRECKVEAINFFLVQLRSHCLWPLAKAFRERLSDILRRLDGLTFANREVLCQSCDSKGWVTSDEACDACNLGFDRQVYGIMEKARAFEGLCLDCVKSKTASWQEGTQTCRIRHNVQTAFSSGALGDGWRTSAE
ncbi:hypothetical protein MMC20_002610 [Loxospora ochrophaea]|nr:hypothetical protein [Loxospora ochrophaea]